LGTGKVALTATAAREWPTGVCRSTASDRRLIVARARTKQAIHLARWGFSLAAAARRK
jgi:hypothetical protein